MYKPPIEIITNGIETVCENGALKLVQEFYPTVNKDELLKALEYDRDQYDKGYVDGATELAEKIKRKLIIEGDITLYTLNDILREMIKG